MRTRRHLLLGHAAPLALSAAALALSACAGTRPRAARAALATPRAACPEDQFWTGKACQPRTSGSDELRRATTALAEFRVDEALALLERALKAGPHTHADYVEIYEQLGIAYAYLEREPEATAAFEMLLRLDPGHLLSYTLSPKATFLFERVRRKARESAPPAVQITWPHQLSVERPVPLDVEVIADPAGFLKRATLHLRARGDSEYELVDLRLPPPGAYKRTLVPAPRSKRAEVLQVYLTARDERGNEVLMWPPQGGPREIPLSYQPPTPWYRKWWIWAITGGVLAASTGAVVYLAGRDLPDTIDGVLEVPP